MASTELTARLAAFGAVAFTLAGVLGGVALRPLADGASTRFAPAAETQKSGKRIEAPDPSAPQGGARSSGAGLPAITVAAVEATTVERRIDVVGASRSLKSVTLTAEATGLVKEVRINSGRKVAAGDLLLQIDDAEQLFELARLKAQYPIAKANSERYADLLANNAASKIEAESAYNAYKSAEANLKAAEFSVSQRAIRAPFAGVVGLTAIEPGDYVRAGDIATTIDDLSSLIIEFSVPQESAGDVKPGQTVRAALTSARNEAFAGKITAVDSRVDAASRTLKVEAAFENPDGTLIPGATYAVSTVNDGAPAIAAPGLAVQWDRAGAFVWRIDNGGVAMRVSVRVLQRRDQLAVLDGDLKPGDIIVVESADRVRPGMRFPDVADAVRAFDVPAES